MTSENTHYERTYYPGDNCPSRGEQSFKSIGCQPDPEELMEEEGGTYWNDEPLPKSFSNECKTKWCYITGEER